jgi:hypothetical protein
VSVVRSLLAAVGLLALVGVMMALPPAEAQGTPPNCSAANLNNWYGYQYNQQVRSTWDSYSSQSRGVCVMRDAQTPVPSDCRFVVQAPWWTASGSPPSPPLCWWGTRDVPVVTVNPPAGCFPTSLSARAAYSQPGVRQTWDYYSSQTRGVCESIGQVPGDCRFTVQGGAGKWLCWWPARGGSALRQVLDRSAYEELTRAALEIPEVCDLIGTGTAIVEFRVGDSRVQVKVEDCRLVDIQWLTPPDGCRDVEPSTYAPIVGQAAIDAGLANAADACLLPRAPQNGECTSSIPVTASSHLCFYGRKTGGTRASVASVAAFTGAARFFVASSEGAVRAILNAEDQAETTKSLLCRGKVAVNADKPTDQLQLRLAMSDLLRDRVCGDLSYDQDDVVVVLGQEARIDWQPDGLGLAPLPDGAAAVSIDRATLGFLPASALPGEPQAKNYTNDPAWVGRILSQPPAEIRERVIPPASNGDEGIDPRIAFAGLLGGLDMDEIRTWWDDGTIVGTGSSSNEFSIIVTEPVQGPDGKMGLLGPRGFIGPPPTDDGAPEESILDDVSECRVICSVSPQSEAFGAGRAYLGGAAVGMHGRNALADAGLVGGLA